MKLTKTLKNAITAHARDEYPKECCGLIVHNMTDGKIDYIRMDNISPDPVGGFEIDPAEFAKIESAFDICAIVHSHPDGSSEPSQVDMAQMSLHGIDWVICGFGRHACGEEYAEIKRHKPKTYQAPLIGREYHHGVQDCYSLVRDYYQRELNIHLPDFPRLDGWWEDAKHEPLYENNFTKAGFAQVHDLQKHDVILCRVGRTEHINHALIYLGDDGQLTSETATPIISTSLILHHPHGRLSVREIYGISWQRRTAMVVRHGQLMANQTKA